MDKVDVRKSYYPSGALKQETPYVDGKRHGILKGYDESGTL
jgi:antitoxin component YwqK of YwqJK toxin-antitoxin module